MGSWFDIPFYQIELWFLEGIRFLNFVNECFFSANSWSFLGCLLDVIGTRGYIDMGIRMNATVEDTVKMQLRRRHRLPLQNLMEEEIAKCRET